MNTVNPAPARPKPPSKRAAASATPPGPRPEVIRGEPYAPFTLEDVRKADKRLEGILAMRVASADGSPSRTLAELHERMAYGPKVTK